MINRFCPTYYYKSVDKIEVNKLSKLGYKYALVDLDNTLTGFHHAYIGDKGTKFIDECNKYNIKVFVISNNNEKRVSKFCKPLNIGYISHADKPFTLKIGHFMKKNKMNKNEVIIIGDQLYTDILTASTLKVSSILVEPITSKDLILTAINRLRDKKLRKKLKENNLLKGIE